MDNNKKITRSIVYLFLLFSFTIIFILFTDNVVEKRKYDDYINSITNQEAKIELINLFQKKLLELELEFVDYYDIKRNKQLENNKNLIDNKISELITLLGIINGGGTFKNNLLLNAPENDEVTELLSYTKVHNCKFDEIDRIQPILQNISKLNNNLYFELKKKSTSNEYSLKTEILLKKYRTYFIRIIELSNFLYTEIHSKINLRKEAADTKLSKFKSYKLFAISLIIIIGLLFSFRLLKRVNSLIKQNKKSFALNDKLLLAMEQSPVTIVITSVEGEIEYVNSNFVETSGYTKEEAIGATPKILKSGTLPVGFYKDLWNTITSGDIWTGEFCNQTKGGKIYWEQAVIAPLTDNKGRIINYIAVKENVTEKKQLVNSLKETSQSLESVINNLPVGIIMLNKKKEILSINKEASRILKYDNKEDANTHLVNNSCHNCITGTKVGECPIFDLGQKSYSLEERQMKGKYGDITVIKSAIPIILNDDTILLEAFMDISAQKKAQKKEKEANIAKSDFLANMSHEIRTPLNGIIGSVEILKGMDVQEEQSQIFSIIKISSENLLNIINDILDFSKIEANKLELDKHSFNLLESIEQVIEQFAYKSNSDNIELLYNIHKEVPENVIGDMIKVMQILINMVGNAFKFTDKGEILLNISLNSINNNIANIQFSIEDSGIGIPKEKLGKIFEAFTQADTSTSREYGGTGLGTTISKTFVEKMGGKINVISPNPRYKDKGSIFTFNLLLDVDKTNKTRDIIFKKSLKVAVVDDNDINLFVLQSFFARYNIDCKIFKASEESAKTINNLDLDLLIVDYQMPIINGIEFINKINKTDKLKTIILSSSNISAKEVKNISVDRITYKPIKFNQLATTINEIFCDIKKEDDLKQVSKLNLELNVLLVEDNLFNQKVASKLLNQIGCVVTIADNGKIAVEKVMQANYDLILMDVQMPIMNGLEATIAIRDKGLTIPIIAMTANATKQDREKCLISGMSNYLSKPIIKADLVKVLGFYSMQKNS